MEIYIPQVPGGAGQTENNPDTYTVKPGDTLESIAAQFGLSPEDIIKANSQDGQIGRLTPGQELSIPPGDNVIGFNTYVAQQGDTKESVAGEFQLDLTALLRANPQLLNNVLLAGSSLKIPQFGQSETTEISQQPDTYTMKLGDSLAEIAKKYNVSAQDLQKLNPHIKDINKTYPGQEIKFSQTKDLDHTKTKTAPSQLAVHTAIGFDNLSKLRFQMQGQPQLSGPIAPGLNQAPITPREEEGEEGGKKKSRKPNMPPPFDKWAEFIYLAAEKYTLDASLIAAVIWCESGGNNIMGKNGHGHGLMQIDDRWHNEWLRTHQQGLDPQTNIDFGTSLLKSYWDRFVGNRHAALAAYSVGPEAVEYALRGNQSMVGSKYALDVLAQQEHFRRFFED